MTVARFSSSTEVERVDYLAYAPQHDLACRYLRLVDDGTPTLDTDVVQHCGSRTPAFFDASAHLPATDSAIKSVATLAISTHAQQGEEGRKLAGIPPTMVRLCVGGEHPDDVIADLDQA